MRRTVLRETIIDYSLGVLSTLTNLTISLVVFGANLTTGSRSPQSVMRAAETASSFSGIDKESLRNAFWKAHHRGLLRRKCYRGKKYWEATKQGLAQLKSELPIYKQHRPWDRRLYLVIYDIPEDQRESRKQLQKHLLKIGARRLQNSVYLILWNPTEILKTFTKEHSLSGMVIISDSGTDGAIGDKSLDELIWEVFGLEELNTRYKTFLENTQNKAQNPQQLAFVYLSILKDDPQLPFELLPPTWKGNIAHNEFQKLAGNSGQTFLLEGRSSLKQEVDA